MGRLSRTQEKAAASLAVAMGRVPVVKFTAAAGGGLRPGAGITTILKHLAAGGAACYMSIAHALYSAKTSDVNLRNPNMSVSDKVHHSKAATRHQSLHHILERAKSAWSSTRVLLVDDLDLVALPKELHSGDRSGVSPEPLILLKALADHASENGLCLVYTSSVEDPERRCGSPFVVELDAYTEEDFAFFLREFCAEKDDVDSVQVYQRFPQLSPAELRVLCVPEAEGAKLGTEEVCKNVHRLTDVLDLEKVEGVDVPSLPGMSKVAKLLETQLLLPFENIGRKGSAFGAPKAGVLLFGPPGTGKTSIGRWLAHRLQGKLFMVNEMSIRRQLQETFAKAEASAPSVVFIDDIDSILHRSKVAWGGGSDLFRFLLAKMDGLLSRKDRKEGSKGQVVVVMSCESPRSLPEALIRSGRIELWVKTEYPKAKQRARILRKFMDESELGAVSDAKVDEVANKTEDMSAADLRRLVGDAQNVWAAGNGEETVEGALDEAVRQLRKMRDEVDQFMKTMYT